MDFVPSQRICSLFDLGGRSPSVAEPHLTIPVFVARRRKQRHRQPAFCSFDGFYDPEPLPQGLMVWSGADANIQCCFSNPTTVRYVWLEVACTAPAGTHIELQMDDAVLIPNQSVKGRTTLFSYLPILEPVKSVNLRIVSATFRPCVTCIDNDDVRDLGIAIARIVFAKRRLRYTPASGIRKMMRTRLGRFWTTMFRNAA